MISILVVGARSSRAPAGDSSIEALHARDAEEALEKLARNRRVDAILLLEVADAAALVEAIREDNPSPPPIFLPADASPIAGARTLTCAEPARLLELVARAITE